MANKNPKDVGELITTLQKQYGIKKAEPKVRTPIPTGSLILDETLGTGGWPTGKLVEIYGAESVGKSTLCMSAISQAQQMGLSTVYIDAENSFDPFYAETLGVDLDENKFLLIQPEFAEQALAALEVSVQTESIGLVILDSVAMMVPSKESVGQGEVGDSHVGLIARNMSQHSRRITPLMAHSNAAVIYVNQVREQIGGNAYYPIKESPGGHAFKHAVHMRILLARTATKDDYPLKGETSIIVKATVKKTKVSEMRDKIANLTIVNGRGLDLNVEIVELLLEHGMINLAGAWYKTADGNTIGQGMSSVYAWLDENPELIMNFLKDEGVNFVYGTRFSGEYSQ